LALRKSRKVSISPTAPWLEDPFERRVHGERLLKLVQTLNDQAYVIALNGDWGTGKSVFLRRLEHHFSNASPSLPFIRIDAWISDDAEDPLIPFVAAIYEAIRETQSGMTKLREDLARAAQKLATPITAFAANLILPGSGTAIDAAAKAGQSLIDWQLSRTTAADEFREVLERARDALTDRKKTRPITRPIVIAIDELDRCRPDFSIKALERIKHFFDVPGVVFLIATDSGNLPAAVRSVYGDAMDGELYLRKFFDYEYRLPTPSAEQNITALWRDFDMDSVLPEIREHHIIERSFHHAENYSETVRKFRSSIDAYEYRRFFSYFSGLFQLTLRDQAQAFTMLSAHIRTTPPEAFVRIPLVDCFMVCLRFFSPSTFELARRGRLSISSSNTEQSEKVRSAFVRIAADPDGKALSKYLSEGSLDRLLEGWRGESRRQMQQGQSDLAFAVMRMERRVEWNHQEPLDYIDGLLSLIFSFSPDIEEEATDAT